MTHTIKYHLIVLFFCCCSLTVFSQGNNCGDTEPVLQCPADLTICMPEFTSAPVTTSSNLPNLEYLIVDYTKPSTSGTGPSVVGTDLDGIFTPSEYALTAGSNFGVIPISYNLAAIQETLDDALKGTFLFIPCCNLIQTATAQDICGDLNAAGIFCGSDVMSLSDASALFGTGAGGDTLSVVDFVAQIDAANATLADPSTPANCGGGDKIAYAYGNECTYSIVADTLMLTMPHSISETAVAVDLVQSSAIINAPLVVTYHANICIELQAGFETVIGADFTAAIADPCL